MRLSWLWWMPMPESRTRTASVRSSKGANSTSTRTSLSEYFTALSSRFETAARSSSRSPVTPTPEAAAQARQLQALADELAEVYDREVERALLLRGAAGVQDLFDGVEKAVAIG